MHEVNYDPKFNHRAGLRHEMSKIGRSELLTVIFFASREDFLVPKTQLFWATVDVARLASPSVGIILFWFYD